MISPRTRKLAAVLIGLGLGAVVLVAANFALGQYVEQQARRELDVTARRVLTLAENRFALGMKALDDLAARGASSCSGADLDAMHEMTFRIVPIKEFSVVEPSGETRCTNLAISLGERRVVASVRSPRADVAIDILRIGNLTEKFARVRRTIADGAALAVMIPSDLLLPRTSSDGGPQVIHASLSVPEGAVIGERLPDANDNSEEQTMTVVVTSAKFGVVVTTSMPRARLAAGEGDVVAMAALGAGGGTAVVFGMLAFVLLRRDDPVAELARAIRNNELVPYYQPIVDLTDARVVSAEVLVRWRKPDGSLVPPVRFIPLAESSGLIVELTRALMRRVVAEAGAEIGKRPNFRIGFNLSARHFLDEEVVGDVHDIFSGSPIALSQVLLEVTERQALTNLTTARRVIAALQGLGAHVGIDDLGTGHSGLSYMMKLGVDFIKLDKMFVDALETERYSTTIIDTLVNLARDMRMEIIAEGVETFEQVQHLRDRGIRKAQGYVFAPPLPGSSFLKLLAASDGSPALKSAEQTAETIPVKKVA